MPTVKIDTLKINFKKDGSGPSIILVHGHGLNLHFYDSLANLLKKDYTVLRYDQRGYGLTDKPLQPPYSTELWADDLYCFLKKLGIKKTVVAGHSMGGRVCATFAANHPRMVKGLIMLNTTWFGSNPKAADELEKSASRVEKEGIATSLDFIPSIKTISKSSRKIAELVTQEQLKNAPVSYALGLRTIAKDFRGESRKKLLKKLKCPTLILVGDRDSAPLEGATKMYKGIKHSRLAVISCSGHFSILERPEVSKAVMIDFLKDINSVLVS